VGQLAYTNVADWFFRRKAVAGLGFRLATWSGSPKRVLASCASRAAALRLSA
jgi:hypothetical protein